MLVLEGEGDAAAPAANGSPAAAAASAPVAASAPAAVAPATPAAPAVPAPTASSLADTVDLDCDLVVLGGGPGGYSAAFRAADLGLKAFIVEGDATLGGVCLNAVCIPSKALLHVAAVMDEVSHMAALGVDFGKPVVNIGKLTGGLALPRAARRSKYFAVSIALIFSAIATTKNWFVVVSSSAAIRFAACLSDAGRRRA